MPPNFFSHTQEQGLFEYPFYASTSALGQGESVPEGTHWITPNAMKLTLFRDVEEEQHEAYGGDSSSN